MKKISVLVTILFLLWGTLGAAQEATSTVKNRIAFNGKNILVHGMNAPWNQFGADFGCKYDSSYFNSMFRELKSSGVNVVRIWIFIQGQCQPTFDFDGNAIGVSPKFYEHFDDFLKRAQKANIAIMPTLWSFDMTKVGSKSIMIRNESATQSFIDKALTPIVTRYKDHPAIFAWEIINEPEWSIVETQSQTCSDGTHDCVTLAEMQRFVGMQISAIHDLTSQYVTVGSASWKWNSDKAPGAVANWWSDAALDKASGKTNAHQDFYQIHYYDWMRNSGGNFSPWDETGPDYFVNFDRPVIIGESPSVAQGKFYSIEDQLNKSLELNYAGLMPWSYLGQDGAGTWKEIKAAMKKFYLLHKEEIDLDLSK